MKMKDTQKILLDSASKRHIDENGFLHVALSHISKETINPYYGREIPGAEDLGLDLDKIYFGYRSGAALDEGAKTFNGLPVLWDHHLESADNPQKEYRIGSLGTDATFNNPYLDNSLIFTDSRAIKAILDGEKVALSAAYMFDPIFQPGEFKGQKYDFLMTNIRGNHVALVDEGRAGPDIVVADSIESIRSKIVTKLKEQLKRALAVFDSAEKVEEKATEKVASDEDKDAKIKEIIDTYFKVATPEEVEKISDILKDLAYSKASFAEEDQDDEDDDAAFDAMKEAMDACGLDSGDIAAQKAFSEGVKYGEKLIRDPEEREKIDKEHESSGMKKAMDAALIVKLAEDRALKKMKDIYAAVEDVRHLTHFHSPHVFDSAESVYEAALKVSGVNPQDHPKSAWKSLCKTMRVSPQMPQIASDSKKLAGSFSHLSKLRIEG